jgi:hypothetical protein
MLVHSGWRGLLWRSSWIMGNETDDAQDGSWRCHCFAQLCLADMPSHVGVDMNGLASYLHRPMVCGRQTRGHSFLSSIDLSHHVTVGGGAFFGVRSPQVWIINVVSTIWVPMLLNLTWRSSLLPRCAYPTTELSWRLCMYPRLSCFAKCRWDRF